MTHEGSRWQMRNPARCSAFVPLLRNDAGGLSAIALGSPCKVSRRAAYVPTTTQALRLCRLAGVHIADWGDVQEHAQPAQPGDGAAQGVLPPLAVQWPGGRHDAEAAAVSWGQSNGHLGCPGAQQRQDAPPPQAAAQAAGRGTEGGPISHLSW